MSNPTNRKPMTLTQKILAHHAQNLSRPWVQAGDVLQIRVDWTIASELAWNGMDRTYQMLGRPGVHDPKRFFLAVDHTVDPVTLQNDKRTQKLTQLSRDFAKESGIQHFYDANVTILHTKFYRDLVMPGQVVLGADDKHLSFRSCVGAEIVSDREIHITLGTRVHCKNGFGRFYMGAIDYVHRHYVTPAMLRRAADYAIIQSV